MLYFENLIRNDFFPAELPPCFNTNDLASNHIHLMNIINNNIEDKSYSNPIIYSGYKNENARRKFAVPNPIQYFKTVDILVKNSKDLMLIFGKSSYSLSCPINRKPKEDESFVKKSRRISDTKEEIERLYQNNLFEIKLDINSFFDSIYTHSIPWAIHGKAQAKNNRSSSFYGNLLDVCIRNMNSQQTNGILVGNAVSRIISEIILCQIDYKISQRYSQIMCRRFVDDYYIFLNDEALKKGVISFIRSELSQYELILNENKAEMLESPFVFDKPWIEEIKHLIHLEPDIFMDKLAMTFQKYKDISTMRYGLKVLSFHLYNRKKWPVIQSKLINIWARFPSLTDIILPILVKNKNYIQQTNVKKVIYDIIENSTALLHHQELIWAVWCVKVLNIKISLEYIKKIVDSRNSMAIIILLDIIQDPKYSKSSKSMLAILSSLKSEIVLEDLNIEGKSGFMMTGKEWLLAYEADLNGWLDFDGTAFDYAKKDIFFSELIAIKVKFYNNNFEYELNENVGPNKTNILTRKEFYQGMQKLKVWIEKHFESNKLEKSDLDIDFSEFEFLDKLDEFASSDY
ncbi:MAG: RNA-directed DNA polymerase [Mariniphaga sp.]